ncbi:EmrB/QacA subfamily drug resistance transporter [Silvimonas terrae]|uniref:EmrB/QacA subfamily drug resistance transporter n=2 Tax=Silvimonas terrae TaxID=300266 RepID=A0A840RM32_9NEIS|nr:EmrB/QacA subfamily drug resistance transporter [Silvimonas terrae]
MELLDSTVMTTALPQMAQSFGTAPVHLSIGVSAYLLALAVFIPISGWLADRFGPRQVFGGAILLFTLASVLCSLSTSLWFFTFARVLQGLGGAMMVPVGRMVVLRATPKDKLVTAIATLTWPALGAPVLGPPLGALITTHWGWHWIFLLNVPFGLLGFVLTLRLVDGAPGGRRGFDTVGFILSGVGCSALMYACNLAAQTPFMASAVLLWGLGGVGALWLAVRHLRRTPHPLVDLDALRIPTFAVAMRGGLLFRMAINSAPFLLPLLFQLGFGYSATTSGTLLLALFAGNLLMKPATTPLMKAWGFRTVLLVNGVMVALGFVLCMALRPDTPYLVTMAVLFFTGLSRSMQFTGFSTFSFCDIPPERMSGASTLSSILTQMSAGLGVALGAVMLRAASVWFPAAGHGVSVTAFRLAFLGMALISAAGLLDLLPLPRNAGAAVSGHQAA